MGAEGEAAATFIRVYANNVVLSTVAGLQSIQNDQKLTPRGRKEAREKYLADHLPVVREAFTCVGELIGPGDRDHVDYLMWVYLASVPLPADLHTNVRLYAVEALSLVAHDEPAQPAGLATRSAPPPAIRGVKSSRRAVFS